MQGRERENGIGTQTGFCTLCEPVHYPLCHGSMLAINQLAPKRSVFQQIGNYTSRSLAKFIVFRVIEPMVVVIPCSKASQLRIALYLLNRLTHQSLKVNTERENQKE